MKTKLAPKKSDPESYVYTLTAVQSRFRRGYVDAYLFLPNDGRIVRVTQANFIRMKQLFQHTAQFGTA